MPKTLLLADDSVTIQKVVGISFASEDVELVTVDNGDDAVAKAREVRPDIVLADVVMPGMTGYEVCEAIKKDPALQHVPVLLLTGTFEAFDEARAQDVGADGHVTKPFEAQALVDTVNARLAAAPPPAPEATPEAPPLEPEAMVEAEPAPAAETGPERSFDFFGAEVGESDSPAPLEDAFSSPAPLDDSFAVPARPAEEAFAFESDSAGSDLPLPAAPVEELHPAPAEEPEALTTAMLVDDATDDALARTQLSLEPEPAAETRVAFEAVEDEAPVDLFDSAPLDAEAPVPPPAADLFAETNASFAGADGPLDPVPAAETSLDPDPSRDYDVSVSDLGAPLAPPPDPDPIEIDPLLDSPPPTVPSLSPPPSFEAPAEPSFEAPAEPSFEAPAEPSFEAPAEPSFEAPAEPVFAAPAEPAFEAPAAPSFDAAAEIAAPLAMELAPGEAPLAVEPEAVQLASEPAAEVTPFDESALRHQLHESLERVAWESFGDLTEKIVAEAVGRIEKVAWEVIPQMAEALIREEIRKIKGDED